MSLRERLDAATAHLAGPLVVVDLDAFEANADDLVRRAGGTPVRLASKSVRVRGLVDAALARPGWAGVMAFSLAEACWQTGSRGSQESALWSGPEAAALRAGADPLARR